MIEKRGKNVKTVAGTKYVPCEQCGENVLVSDTATRALCDLCIVKRNLNNYGWPQGTQLQTPEEVVPKPRGWHLMSVFVDDLGNVYHKGVIQPELEGTLPSTPFENKPKEKVKRQFRQSKKDKEREMLDKIWKEKTEMKKMDNARTVSVKQKRVKRKGG